MKSSQDQKLRTWRAVQVPNSALCPKAGGGPCEGTFDWWVVTRDRSTTSGPNCERHAKLLADELEAHG